MLKLYRTRPDSGSAAIATLESLWHERHHSDWLALLALAKVVLRIHLAEKKKREFGGGVLGLVDPARLKRLLDQWAESMARLFAEPPASWQDEHGAVLIS
jgi:hypothetical protein